MRFLRFQERAILNRHIMDKIMSEALQKLLLLEKKAVKFGMEWPNEEAILQQSISECAEIREAIQNNELSDRVQEEIGDLIHTAISLCRFAGFDLEETIAKVANKFDKRMNALEKVTKAHGLDSLDGQSIEFKLELWDEAKKMEYKSQS